MFPGYWHNPEATAEILADEGWLRSGDLGELDDEGFLKVTGRKKEIIVTAGGKNVAPAVLEDRLRAHPLISQCLVVGDGRPYIACLVTLDEEALEHWKQQHGKPASATVADLATDPDLLADIQAAVDDANKAVSQGRVDPQVPGAARGLHRGQRPPDAVAEDPPVSGGQGLRGRDRRPLQLAATAGTGPKRRRTADGP